MNTKTNNVVNRLKEFAHKEVGILISGLIVVLGFLIFAIIADNVTDNSTQNFDESILKKIRTGDNYENAIGPYWLTNTMRDITALGGGTVLTIITAAIVFFLILKKKYWATWFLFVAILGGALINILLKEIFNRHRPDIVTHLIDVEYLSFPSGHSTMAAVTYLTLAVILTRVEPDRKVRIYIISVALFLTFIIGLSRIYLGVHYPTDVLAGWCLGLTWASLCWFGFRFIQRNYKKEMRYFNDG